MEKQQIKNIKFNLEVRRPIIQRKKCLAVRKALLETIRAFQLLTQVNRVHLINPHLRSQQQLSVQLVDSVKLKIRCSVQALQLLLAGSLAVAQRLKLQHLDVSLFFHKILLRRFMKTFTIFSYIWTAAPATTTTDFIIRPAAK